MKKITLISAVLLIILSLSGCKQNTPDKSQNGPNITGKTTVNNGSAQSSQDKANQEDSTNNKENNNVNIIGRPTTRYQYHIQPCTWEGNYIYYADGLSEDKIRKIDMTKLMPSPYDMDGINGTPVTTEKMNNVSFLNVVNGVLYFQAKIDKKDWICSIKDDGTNFKRLVPLNDNVSDSNLIVCKDKLFFTDGNAPIDFNLYMADIDGQNKISLASNLREGMRMQFYYNNDKLTFLYEMKYKGTILFGKLEIGQYDMKSKQYTVLAAIDSKDEISNGSYLLGKDFYLHWTKDESKNDFLEKVNYKTIEKEHLQITEAFSAILLNNKIYYPNVSDNRKIYVYDINKKSSTKLSDASSIYEFQILKDKLFYFIDSTKEWRSINITN